jgi:RecA-family ATPase
MRLSRLPGVPRGDSFQQLVAQNIGAANWEAWEATANFDDGLPDIVNPQEFLSKRMELDPYIIEGLLREKSKMSFTSKAKEGKTWIQLYMALCIGSGTPWLNRKTNRSSVLYVNLELKENGLNNRVWDICEKMGLDPATGHDVDFWNLRGKSADIEVMVKRIVRRMQRKQYAVVFLDPAYKCLGWRDDCKGRDITDFQNHLEKIATEAGAAIITTGHTTKGDQSAKAANDL